MNRTRWIRHTLLGALALVACVCHAQSPAAAAPYPNNYPNKPIKIVVPYSPGAINDVLARAVADRLQASLGQPVVVENRAGGGAVIGTQAVAGAAPDGYTLLQVAAAHSINATLVPKLPYDSIASFSFITLAATSPFLLLVNYDSPLQSVRELVELDKKKPGVYSYSSSGNGGTAHLMAEMLKDMAKIDVVHVPYKGASPAITDLIGGQVQFTFSTYPGAQAVLKAKRVRALAVTSAKRWSAFPDIPTIAENGYPKYDADGWWGFVAPAGTPPAIVAKLNREINKVLAEPALRQSLTSEGIEVLGTTPEAFRTHVESEIRAWAKIIQGAGIKAD